MLKNNEKTILNLIRYAPLLLIVILSILIANAVIINNKKEYEKDIIKIEKEFISNKKALIKDEVENLYDYILYKKQKSEENLKRELKNRVLEAHTIAWSIYNTNKDKSKETIFKMIKDALRNIRFNNGRGYFFIHDIKGNNQMYPLDPSIEGNNYMNLKDINGYYFVKTIVDTIKNKTETFDTYYWSKPASDEKDRIYKKIAFYKYFEPLNITISTGEYLEEFEQEIKERILEFINIQNSQKESYFFIYDYNGILLAHKNPDILGKSLIELEREQRSKIGDRFIQIAKSGDAFFMYDSIYTRLDEKRSNLKTSYIKGFDEWKWGIGTGFYKNELYEIIKKRKTEMEEENKEYISNILLLCFYITLILLVLSFYISSTIEKRFVKYKNKIYKEMDKNRKKDTILAQQSKMAAMGEMIGNIAHQWRQPLSLISTAASGIKMQKEFGILDDEHLIHSVDSITNATQHLSKTIDDFKNFFNPNKEKSIFTTKGVIKKTRNLINAQFEDKHIEIIEDIEEIELYTLENELIQVLLNIFNNAKDEFLKHEEIERYIFIDVRKIANEVKIEIKDNAGGISQSIIDRVFEPYFTTKHQSQGTGIGLYMSEEIVVKHMHGTMGVENRTYKYKNKEYTGAVFTITLPVS